MTGVIFHAKKMNKNKNKWQKKEKKMVSFNLINVSPPLAKKKKTEEEERKKLKKKV